jgi:predicted nucleic acid-binding protein
MVIDACCTLNLLATRLEVEIATACGLSLLISDKAHEEALFLHSSPDADGVRSKEPASTERLVQIGHLAIRRLDTDSLVEAFVECAAQLRDQDASCIALAGVLQLPLLTDDGKERRVARALFPNIDLVSTLDVLQEASQTLKLSDDDLTRMAADLRWRGNFAPPQKDPRSAWYAELLKRAGISI